MSEVILVHDRLTTPGGGERVIYYMSKILDADIITGKYKKDSTYDFSHTSVWELSANNFRSFVAARRHVDWDDYNVAIFSGNRPQFTVYRSLPIPTIRYCHSPVRTFWSLRDKEFRQTTLPAKPVRLALASIFRQVDKHMSNNHDKILVNSHNIRSQVDRFYGLDSETLFPPVDLDEYHYHNSGDFWLSVNRLVPKKRVEEQVEAFRGIEEKLVIIGGIDELYEEYANRVMKKIDALDNVTLKGFVDDDELKDLYSKCKGVIYIPHFEDFGIVPIEAMASGKPVVAAAEGGPLETVHDGFTGWTIQPNKKEIRSSIQKGFSAEKFREDCQSSVEKYSLERFKRDLEKQISDLVKSEE